MTEEEIYKKAKKRIKQKKGFFVHFGIFAATAALLFTINYITIAESNMWWAFIPSVAWGIGIVAHYIIVFGVGIFSKLIESFGYEAPIDDNWEENALEKEMEKIRSKHLPSKRETNISQPDEKLELREIEKLRNELDDKDFV